MPPDSVSRSTALPTDRLVTPASLAEPWWRSFHKTGDVSVLHVDLTPCVAREKRAMAWLDQQEQARCRRYLFPRPRREFVLCRAALRAILCGELGCGNEAHSLHHRNNSNEIRHH